MKNSPRGRQKGSQTKKARRDESENLKATLSRPRSGEEMRCVEEMKRWERKDKKQEWRKGRAKTIALARQSLIENARVWSQY